MRTARTARAIARAETQGFNARAAGTMAAKKGIMESRTHGDLVATTELIAVDDGGRSGWRERVVMVARAAWWRGPRYAWSWVRCEIKIWQARREQ